MLKEFTLLTKIVMTTKRITIATVKSFIRRNEGNLFQQGISGFNGMTDMVEQIEDVLAPAIPTESNVKYSLGILGAHFVGRSRDHFSPFESGAYVGYQVSNACGSFVIATTK